MTSKKQLKRTITLTPKPKGNITMTPKISLQRKPSVPFNKARYIA